MIIYSYTVIIHPSLCAYIHPLLPLLRLTSSIIIPILAPWHLITAQVGLPQNDQLTNLFPSLAPVGIGVECSLQHSESLSQARLSVYSWKGWGVDFDFTLLSFFLVPEYITTFRSKTELIITSPKAVELAQFLQSHISPCTFVKSIHIMTVMTVIVSTVYVV